MNTATPAALPPSPAPSRRALRRRVAGAALTVALLPFLALGAGIARMWPDPLPRHTERQGEIARVERTLEARGELVREDLRVVSTSGLEVEVAVLRPAAAGQRALMVLLVGHRTGKEAVELFTDTGDTAVAAISYPYDGPHRLKLPGGLLTIPRVQTALLDTTPAVMLAVDALAREVYVDLDRIELVGVSLGALLGPKIAALDPRFQRVWLVHGAGDPVRLLAHGMEKRVGREGVRLLLARTLAALGGARHFAPERWLEHISPRKLMLVNAIEDERMPIECVEVLHGSAGDPHEIIWLPGAHVRVSRDDIVQELFELVRDRIEADTEALATQPAAR